MSRITGKPLLREKHTRPAKDKANIQINNYFKPKRVLQLIAENDEMIFQTKPLKDKNNNNAKRSLEDLEPDSIQIEENTSRLLTTELFSEAKRKKVFQTSTPIPKKVQPEDDGIESDVSLGPTLSDDIVVVLDSSNDTSSGVMVDSSVSSTSTQTDFGFDALHTDDPTDVSEDEERDPYWSLYQNRIAIVKDQATVNFNVIDKFFSCKHETVDSRTIFPLSVAIKRRRSTAKWNTPPRYSTLPKY